MKMFARIFAIAMTVLILAAPSANAQQWSLDIEGERVRLNLPPGATSPTLDELVARLNTIAGMPDVADGVVHPGDVVFIAPVRHGNTWRLQNDVFRLGSDDVFLPRGSPLYESEWRYEVRSAQGAQVHDLRWRIWCAPPP